MIRTMTVLSVAVLAAFLGILLWEVPRLDLGLVIVVTLVLAVADLVRTVRDG